MTFSEADVTALIITLKLAGITTLCLLVIGTPLAWWLARSQSHFKLFVEGIVGLPLVLPPTVLGFYLLVALGNQSPIGQFITSLTGESIAFSFTGLVLGSIIYSMPFVVQPLQNAFTLIGQSPLDTAATLRATPLERFFLVAIPLARPGFITATVLGFAHTVGEFGVVLMIGGNIPGETKVLSIAIYDHVESLQYGQAHLLSAILLLLSFLLLVVVFAVNRKMSLGQIYD